MQRGNKEIQPVGKASSDRGRNQPGVDATRHTATATAITTERHHGRLTEHIAGRRNESRLHYNNPACTRGLSRYKVSTAWHARPGFA